MSTNSKSLLPQTAVMSSNIIPSSGRGANRNNIRLVYNGSFYTRPSNKNTCPSPEPPKEQSLKLEVMKYRAPMVGNHRVLRIPTLGKTLPKFNPSSSTHLLHNHFVNRVIIPENVDAPYEDTTTDQNYDLTEEEAQFRDSVYWTLKEKYSRQAIKAATKGTEEAVARPRGRPRKCPMKTIETPEEREIRLEKQRERQRRFYARETEEQRQRRLARAREYAKKRTKKYKMQNDR